MKIPVCLFAMITLSVICISCNDSDDTGNPDFRDGFTGDYTCMETHFYFCPEGDSMFWCLDTVAYDAVIRIEISDDSAVVVSKFVDSTFQFRFKAFYSGNNMFECMDCGGPPSYAEFFPPDSLRIFEKAGATNSNDFYGRK